MIDFILASSFSLGVNLWSGSALVDPRIANPNIAIAIKTTTTMIEMTYNTINDILTHLKAPLFSSPIFELRNEHFYQIFIESKKFSIYNFQP